MHKNLKKIKIKLRVLEVYIPHLQETRRQVGARVCVERLVQSAQHEVLLREALNLPPEDPPFPRCAGNQTPLMHSVTTLLSAY